MSRSVSTNHGWAQRSEISVGKQLRLIYLRAVSVFSVSLL
jgi:hypothetical protein